MTHFMRRLYAGYIRPPLEERDATGDETSLSLVETTLDWYSGGSTRSWRFTQVTRSFWACGQARTCAAQPKSSTSKALF